jgi:hypothetical protein
VRRNGLVVALSFSADTHILLNGRHDHIEQLVVAGRDLTPPPRPPPPPPPGPANLAPRPPRPPPLAPRRPGWRRSSPSPASAIRSSKPWRSTSSPARCPLNAATASKTRSPAASPAAWPATPTPS